MAFFFLLSIYLTKFGKNSLISAIPTTKKLATYSPYTFVFGPHIFKIPLCDTNTKHQTSLDTECLPLFPGLYWAPTFISFQPNGMRPLYNIPAVEFDCR